MEYKKNDLLTVTIEDMGHDGEGIGKVDGYTVFVKDTVIGDKVQAKIMKAKKNYGYARLVEIMEPSKDRVEPRCAYARQCGGCQIQALSYEKQLAYKQQKIENNLIRIGGFQKEEIPMQPIIGMEDPYHYRNKAQFPVGCDKEGHLIAGFYAGRTHSIISNRKCYLGVEVNEQILNLVLAHMEAYDIPVYDETTGKGLVRHVLIRYGFQSKEIMVCLVVNGSRIPGAEDLIAKLREIPGMTSISLNINREKTNVILGRKGKLLWGQEYITDTIGPIAYQISPQSFYQVNPVQTKNLYEKAISMAGLTGNERVMDAYCGIGTIGLIASRNAKEVISVELNPDAVRDAVTNAKRNGIKNVSFYQNDAGAFMVSMAEKGEKADVVFMDPPRAGSDEAFLSSVVMLAPEKIVYISCNPETLARDLRYLTKHGYRAEEAWGYDMFAWSEHVETVCLLSRKAQ